MSATSDEYLIRPAKPDEKTAIWQLLLNKSSKASLWFTLTIFLLAIAISIIGIVYIALNLIIFPAGDYLKVYGLEAKFVVNFSFVSLLFLGFPICYLWWLASAGYKSTNSDYCLVALDRNKIIGCVSLIKLNGRHKISRLIVKTEYRQKGIGTKLLQEIIQNTQYPIYVDSIPLQSSFYTRLGFKEVEAKKSGKAWLDKYDLVKKLVLLPNSFSVKSNKSPANNEYIIQPAIIQDVKVIYRLLENIYDNIQDSFLPFGYNAIIRISFPLCLVFILEIIGVVLVAFALIFGLSDIVTVIIMAIAIALFFAGLIFLPKITSALIVQKISQFYLIKARDNVIGYARISRNREYSILHHIYVFSSYGLEPIDRIIEYFARQETQPIYVACPRKVAKLYYKHGFRPIKVKELPIKLQSGGKISAKFGGANLVLWS